MLILQVGDLAAARARVDELGIRVVHEVTPARHHGVEASALHLHPADTGGAIISLDQMRPDDGWAWAGRAWRGHVHTDVVAAIVGVELQSADPAGLAARLGRLFDRDVSDGTIELDASLVRVVPGELGAPDQLTAVELRATAAERRGKSITIAGTELRFV